MAITRTPMIDDDGSGTTGTIINNAWKQELYQQIDSIPLLGWVPIDVSGAGLSFAGRVSFAYYCQVGRTVTVCLNMTFPATSNGLGVQLAGLPILPGMASGFYTTYGILRVWHLQGGSGTIFAMHPTTGAQVTNAELSGQSVVFTGTYFL